MPAEKKTGTVIPSGILQPTARHEAPGPPAAEGQGGEPPPPKDEATATEPKLPRLRRKKTPAAPAERLEGRRLYLSDSVYFRLRLFAWQRKLKLSEAAEEILDKNLPRWDVNRVG